ncbi:MAG TPA: tRNA pseudouridine(38-40) synthase TruA [Actinomycetota bacterium]|nr:tRNA pseudouridine(38-40) synthase TruA [Actinomycetota bacterium]
MKLALLVAYDGTDFHGFARQRVHRTVQGVLEERLSLVLRAPVTTTTAGRTDTGVHAAGQVVSFDAPENTDPQWLRQRLNKWLAPEVAVRAAVEVPASFDARFSAQSRVYEYRCYTGVARDPFQDRFALWLPSDVSVSAMRAGSRALIGEHDFASFCRKGKTGTIRKMHSIRFARDGNRLTFRIEANAFCHQMVRSLVGLLLEVGGGVKPPTAVSEALAARDRAEAGAVAAARGLHLVWVHYKPEVFAEA